MGCIVLGCCVWVPKRCPRAPWLRDNYPGEGARDELVGVQLNPASRYLSIRNFGFVVGGNGGSRDDLRVLIQTEVIAIPPA